MDEKDKPKLVVIAGPNGAGKSTLTSSAYPQLIKETVFINPDEIVQEIKHLYPNVDNNQRLIIAGRKALKTYEDCFEKRLSFSLETTLSGNTPIKIIKKAREKGYHITLAYVGIESSLDSVARVRERVQQGGHDVPVKDILRRYNRSMKNLPVGISLSDVTLIFDNSQAKHQLLLFLEKNIIKEIYIEQNPSWLKTLLMKPNIKLNKVLIFRI